MRFFILGDSWGVGEWAQVNGLFESVPGTGLGDYLTQLGHTVTNISAGSAGNFGQLRHAYWTLQADSNYDYIIWVHTESMRDIEEIIINDPEEGARQFPKFNIASWEPALDYLDWANYNYAESMWQEFGIPFIVIGGQCPVNPCIEQFSFARHTVHSWLADLLELDFVPPKNTFFSWEKIKRILDHYKINQRSFILNNIDALDLSEAIQYLARSNELFPDNAHPSRTCHYNMAVNILKMIQNDQQS